MNANSCRVVLRPRGPFEVLDLAIRMSRVRWWPFLLLACWLVLPIWLVLSALSWLTGGAWWLLAVPIVLAPVLQAPFTLLGGRLLFADEVSLREVFRDTLTGRLVGAWLAFGAGVLASGVTCFYGIPFVQGALMFGTESALLEKKGLAQGTGRSFRLAGAAAGQTIGGLVVRWGLLFWCALAAEGFGQAVVGFVLQLGEPFGSLWTGQVTPFLLGGLLLSQPAWAIYRLLLYLDVRTRTEGWDLQVGLWAAGQSS